jgi:hypothetical protein
MEREEHVKEVSVLWEEVAQARKTIKGESSGVWVLAFWANGKTMREGWSHLSPAKGLGLILNTITMLSGNFD